MILKKGKVSIRYQEVKDAKRFVEILNNENFKYFGARPTLKEEIKSLKTKKKLRKTNVVHDFTIMYGDEIVGGGGLKINQTRPYIGEIGYFIDEKYWGKGIATTAVRLIERYGFEKLRLIRIEIVMRPGNKSSERVAIKAGYKKEGNMKKYYTTKVDGDDSAQLYAKTSWYLNTNED